MEEDAKLNDFELSEEDTKLILTAQKKIQVLNGKLPRLADLIKAGDKEKSKEMVDEMKKYLWEDE